MDERSNAQGHRLCEPGGLHLQITRIHSSIRRIFLLVVLLIEDYEFVASSLIEAGYAVIIPDYRLFPEVVFPVFVEDGAHIASLLSTDQRFLAEYGIHLDSLQGFIGLSGPYDFLPIESGYLLDVFPNDQREASQPVNFVTAAAPPSLLIHETKRFLETLSERTQ